MIVLYTARLHGILLYRLNREVWGEWLYDGGDMLILSNAVIPFPRGGEECDPQPRERMVMDKHPL